MATVAEDTATEVGINSKHRTHTMKPSDPLHCCSPMALCTAGYIWQAKLPSLIT